jgi:aminoglycoside phosphotransferase (APT) family kinase protein
MTTDRSRDELDIEQRDALLDYLRRSGRIEPDESPRTEVLRGGVSNRTVLVERDHGVAWVLKQALGKLRVEVDWFSDPARVHREATGLLWLERLAPPGAITPLVFEDHEHHLIAMQAVPKPHDNYKTLLLAGRVEMSHVEQFATLLGTIHRAAEAQRDAIAGAFDDRTFFESLRLEPYYTYTATQVPEAAAFIDTLAADTRAGRFTLVHGDYSPKNVLIHHDRLVLLDHEVIHYGDGGFDLGFSLTHYLSKAHHLVDRRDTFVTAALRYWETYVAAIGDVPWARKIESRAVRHTLGCLLGRVSGRSKLEYLAAAERDRQRDAVLRMLADVPDHVPELVHRFVAEL